MIDRMSTQFIRTGTPDVANRYDSVNRRQTRGENRKALQTYEAIVSASRAEKPESCGRCQDLEAQVKALKSILLQNERGTTLRVNVERVTVPAEKKVNPIIMKSTQWSSKMECTYR